jgi:hypothetical protein
MQRKKYEQLVDFTMLGVDALMVIKNHPEYVESSYTITTNGGASILWQVNRKPKDGGIIHTVSTNPEKYESVEMNGRNGGRFMKQFPVYRHYILTPKGFNVLKGLTVELNI